MKKQCDVKRGVAAVLRGVGQPKPETVGEPGKETPKVSPADCNSFSAPTSDTQAEKGALAKAEPASPSQEHQWHGRPSEGKIKATYYLDQALVIQMKHLAIDLRKKDSDMVAEGLLEIIKKYENTIDPRSHHRSRLPPGDTVIA